MFRESIIILALTLLVALAVFSATPAKKAAEKESVKNIYEIFNEGNALFLDARTFKQYAEGHFPGAINLPVHEENGIDLLFKLEDMLQSAPRLVVYCTGIGCGLSDILAEKLVEIGVPKEKIIVFEGGMDAWEQARYPVSTDTEFQKSLQQ
ncbi:MAG: rhodanese-like domain-containing protein [Holophagae bacterium]|nr:rhodanese-like domain-containing protein [Holophagae bacterium]